MARLLSVTLVKRFSGTEDNTAEQAVIQATGLTTGYRNRPIVTDLDLSIGPGATALVGPNGAGKTTLLNVLATVRRPEQGSLRILGCDARSSRQRREVRRRLGFLPQSFGYYPSFSGRDFVEYNAWLKRVPKDSTAALALRAIEAVGLTEEASRPLRAYSGGMLRRAGIAAAMVHQPELLILDEPAAGLDPQQRIELRGLIRGLAQTRCVLISTHLVEDVRTSCQQVIVLNRGDIAFSGSPTALEALATQQAPGDSALERGYSVALARHAVLK